MRIAFVTLYDPTDVRRMSGTGYHISRSLEDAGVEIEYIGPLKKQYHPVNLSRHALNRVVHRKNDHPQRDRGFLRYYAKQVEEALRGSKVDAVVGSGGLPLAYLETDLPIVLWTDCTFASLLNYYDKFSNLSERTIRDGHQAEQSLFDRISLAILTSEWAAESAVRDYGFDRDRIVVIPRGANVPTEHDEGDIDAMIDARPRDRCRLLFAGIAWRRKRGFIALEAARLLNMRGISTELVVVGCEPEGYSPLPDFVTLAGYVDKSTSEGMRQMCEHYARSHFLVLPTRADCTPIVMAEANAYGTPVLATRTGAVDSVIHDHDNGCLFEMNASPSQYADRIAELMADRDTYRTMCHRAFQAYRTRLNWPAVAQQAKEALGRVIRPDQAGSPRVAASA
jgi:glycosyltransferase involved in cell wall biosynthesis